MTKQEIIDKIKNVETTSAMNLMGCSENWYNPFYAMRETFGIDKLKAMTEDELNNLVKLANTLSEMFY